MKNLYNYIPNFIVEKIQIHESDAKNEIISFDLYEESDISFNNDLVLLNAFVDSIIGFNFY